MTDVTDHLQSLAMLSRTYHDQIVEVRTSEGSVLDVVIFDWALLPSSERKTLTRLEAPDSECRVSIEAGSLIPFALVPTIAPEGGSLVDYLQEELSGLLLLDVLDGSVVLSDGDSLEIFSKRLRILAFSLL
jgi:hypothetical protein